MLAQRGLTAAPNILEGKLGFCNVFYGEEHYDLANIGASIAHPFDYVSSMRIKKYSSCGQTARPIDAMLALANDHDIHPGQVAHVECGINPSVMNILMYSNPATGLEGKFSLEFCLAVALLDRKVVLGDFTDERVKDPRVREMIRKISKYPDPAVPHSGGTGPIVKVRMLDGREHSRRMDMGEDQPWTAPTDEERIAKYRDCAKRVLNDQKIEACLKLIRNLEEVKDIREVVASVSP
jgi:2-methylcitrate dehydratase PrpD